MIGLGIWIWQSIWGPAVYSGGGGGGGIALQADFENTATTEAWVFW